MHGEQVLDERPTSRSRRLAVRVGMLGPAFVAAVAYVDPGNVAANLQAGSRYGYLLVRVLVVATASAGFVQFLSAKLGLTTGATLPELVGRRLGRRASAWRSADRLAATPITPKGSCESQSGSTTSNAARVLLHEAAHVTLHGPDSGFITTGQYAASRTHRGTAEIQADGAAYVLADLLGLDTEQASIGYVAGWAAAAAGTRTDADAITAAVRGTAAAILHAVNTIAEAIGLDD